MSKPQVFDRKLNKMVDATVDMNVKFIVGDDDPKPADKILAQQLSEKFTIKQISFDDYRKRSLLHFTDHTHTSHPEQMEVWYDDLNLKESA